MEKGIGDIEDNLVVYATSHGVRGNLVVRKVFCILCIQMVGRPYLHFWSAFTRAIACSEVMRLTASFMPLRSKSAIAIAIEGFSIAYS